ncbi:MAG: peptide MFS transporter [Bryobacterales bacterium]
MTNHPRTRAEKATVPAGGLPQAVWFGHPRGLSTLFFTEMWERFSYYGMRALLILFMTAPLAGVNPGLGFDVAKSTAIYGLYTALVYLVALPGGWIADKLWGQRKAVFVGGCIIAAGHFSMAIAMLPTFYLGLTLIVIGTGLLKPNVSAMVGDLYPEGGARRDAGFSVFYMGINLGAFLGTILCGLIGEGYNFHWGFSLAGIGMVLGLIQYRFGGKYLGGAGELKSDDSPEALSRRGRTASTVAAVVAALLAILTFTMWSGTLVITIQELATMLGYGILVVSALFFLYLFVAGGLTPVEKGRLGVIIWLYLLAAVFWSGFEQAGSSMNLFARDLTDRMVGGMEMPASWLQNVNPVLIIVLAPVFGFLWTWLAQRKAHPSAPTKFGLGLLGLSMGFFVLSWGSANASVTSRVSMSWLVVTYFLHTAGELCLSPVGLSSMTKLAPRGRVGQMMGVWFIAAALGNLFAGLFAGQLEQLAPTELFWNVALLVGGAGVVALLFSKVVNRFTRGLE